MEGVDRISNLPDLVLSHILSFLSTNEAVRTSILSTRWRKISSLLSNLSFDHDWNSNDLDSYYFMNFVDRVLFYRTGDVDKFHLECGEAVDPYRVDGWIRYALLNRVREIDICIHSPRIMELPLGIFTCETLVVLRLQIFVSDSINDLKVAVKICCPNLKILHVSGFNFPKDNSIQRLLSSCLVLEEFVIDDCFFPGELNICSPTLKRLTITGLFCGKHVILIDAPRLVYLSSDLPTCVLSMKNLNSLVKACLHFHGVIDNGAIADLLKGISNAQSLRLSLFFTAEPFLEDTSPVCVLPKVTYLNLYFYSGQWEGVLPHLLSWFPCLEELHVTVMVLSSCDTKKEFPPFLWSRLKTLESLSFKGQKNEYQMIMYLLKNAQVLEKLTIWTKLWKSKVTKNLLRLPRVSKKCIISVV